MRMRVLAVMAAVGLLGCGDSGTKKKTYYMVTHGASTNQGFWGNVLAGANEEAAAADITLIPLHPATEVTGAELDKLMDQAIAAKPEGILATIWGDGMPQRVASANSAGVPIAAINVYPDPTVYTTSGPGMPTFILYSGQQDYDAATSTTDALVCSASGLGDLANAQCGTSPLATAYATVKGAGAVAFAVFKNESSGGVNSREQAMKDRVAVLDPTVTVDTVEWDRNTPGDDSAKISAFFAQPSVQGAVRVFVMAAAADAAVPLAAYLDANPAAAANLSAATFDRPTTACPGFSAGWLKFWVDQNETAQGKKALHYLRSYKATGVLPAPGADIDGAPEPAWTTSVDGYPWYRTGPLFHSGC